AVRSRWPRRERRGWPHSYLCPNPPACLVTHSLSPPGTPSAQSWSTPLWLHNTPLGGGVCLSGESPLCTGCCSYLVDPASNICLSQRLSHAGLSAHGVTVKLRMA